MSVRVLKTLQHPASLILALPKSAKRVIVLTVDASLCVLSGWLAFYLRLGEFAPISGPVLLVAIVSTTFALPIFIIAGLYRAIFRYSGLPALIAVGKATAIYGVIFAITFSAIGVPGVPRTIGIIQPLVLLLLVGSTRGIARFWLGGLYREHLKRAPAAKALIYGAGDAGRQLAAAMAQTSEMRVVGFLDDDRRLQGRDINGIPIHAPTDLPRLAKSLGVADILLAMPSVTRKRRNEILTRIQGSNVAVRSLPSLTELAQGKVSTVDLRELDIDDLLGRDSVEPDLVLMSRNITGKVVMVTGAGGSIGSEICRQIVTASPTMLLLIDQSEFALYEIHQELQQRLSSSGSRNITVIPLLASVCNGNRIREIVSTWRPHSIYHAAAYKHVPLVEQNPIEGISNNALGTRVAAQVAEECGVENFVLISTDKAVRPTNFMGASKRVAELILQAWSARGSRTRFSIVRFGNVLGSSGSVVPKFRRQIKAGGPVSLTHPDVTRYFMTIPEAAQLVIQAGAMARGGEVFVLDMGEPIKILNLARRMIELSGLTVRDDANPDGDIEIEITGLRPGEKLYEELLIGDNPMPTAHRKILQANEHFVPWDALNERLGELTTAMDANDVKALRVLMQALVPGYAPKDEIADWVHNEQWIASERVAVSLHQKRNLRKRVLNQRTRSKEHGVGSEFAPN